MYVLKRYLCGFCSAVVCEHMGGESWSTVPVRTQPRVPNSKILLRFTWELHEKAAFYEDNVTSQCFWFRAADDINECNH